MLIVLGCTSPQKGKKKKKKRKNNNNNNINNQINKIATVIRIMKSKVPQMGNLFFLEGEKRKREQTVEEK